MVTVDPVRLLALTFFANPDINKQVKNKEITKLPPFSIWGQSSSTAQPVLPGLLQALSPNINVPADLPTTPEIDLPPAWFTWVGKDKKSVQLPSKDAFYNPDISTYKDLKNGDVVATRPVGFGLSFGEVDKAYQISYRTESTSGEPRVDVTTLLIPKKYDGKNMVSFQMWEDACNSKCAPSYQFMTGVHDPTIDLFLKRGYIVNAPDMRA